MLTGKEKKIFFIEYKNYLRLFPKVCFILVKQIMIAKTLHLLVKKIVWQKVLIKIYYGKLHLYFVINYYHLTPLFNVIFFLAKKTHLNVTS